MFKKLKKMAMKRKQLLLYMFFGVTTTAISIVFCFLTVHGITLVWKNAAGKPTMVADVLGSTSQWVSGVLIAFYTNKRWVFPDAEKGREATRRQFWIFTGSRLATYFVEVVVNLGAIAILERIWGVESVNADEYLLGFPVGTRLVAKVISSLFVVVVNYYFTKVVVFHSDGIPPQNDEKKKKGDKKEKKSKN